MCRVGETVSTELKDPMKNFYYSAMLLLVACSASFPSEPLLTRCERESRWSALPLYQTFEIQCEPLPQEMVATPRQIRQYYLSCPNHPYYCYRKAELICGSNYNLLRTASFANPGELIVECN